MQLGGARTFAASSDACDKSNGRIYVPPTRALDGDRHISAADSFDRTRHYRWDVPGNHQRHSAGLRRDSDLQGDPDAGTRRAKMAAIVFAPRTFVEVVSVTPW